LGIRRAKWQEVGENSIINLVFYTPHCTWLGCWDDGLREDEMRSAYSIYGEAEKCMQSLDKET
jgi:hypothetical protein